MANARDNPQAWDEMLNALGAGDIKKAQEIVIKYEFDKNKKSQVKYGRKNLHIYFCKSPVGEVRRFESGSKMAEFLKVSRSTIHQRFHKNELMGKEGVLKGWEIWRELNWEDD